MVLNAFGIQLKRRGPLTAKDWSTTDFIRAVAVGLRAGTSHSKPLLSLNLVFMENLWSSKFGVIPRTILYTYKIVYLSRRLSSEYNLSFFQFDTQKYFTQRSCIVFNNKSNLFLCKWYTKNYFTQHAVYFYHLTFYFITFITFLYILFSTFMNTFFVFLFSRIHSDEVNIKVFTSVYEDFKLWNQAEMSKNNGCRCHKFKDISI